MPKGFVYILVSPNSRYIKIGGTSHPLAKRLREINGPGSYRAHGPWDLSDFLQVSDWQLVERQIHAHFVREHVRDVNGTRELFAVAPRDARSQLREVDPALRIGHERTAELFRSRDLQLFLYKLLHFSGLFGNLDIQGAWVLSILSSTLGRARWFTLSIGPHEVAFSTREDPPRHYLVVDRLILDYPETVLWMGKHDGDVCEADYRTARERSVVVSFRNGFADAERVFKLPGIRRALIAYWSEALADLRERSAQSTYARYHAYDAVAELWKYKRAAEAGVR